MCPKCTTHYGAWEKADRAHVEEWRKVLDCTVDENAALHGIARQRIAELEERVDEFLALTVENYATRPLGDLQQFVQAEVVRDAERKRDSAFRLRGRAMAALWHVDELHRLAAPDDRNCTCGRSTRECKEFASVDAMREELYEWERRQIERLKAGNMHELPNEHPEVRKHGGAWGAREFYRGYR